MKQLFYSCLAICALLFASCADKDIVDNINGEDNQPGITVSMAMEGNMQADKPALTSRADPPNKRHWIRNRRQHWLSYSRRYIQ